MTKQTRKVVLTNRERLWKQVNKKTTKVKYTFNPTEYRSTTFDDEDQKVVIKPRIIDYDDVVPWVEVISNISWSCIVDMAEPNDEDYAEDIEEVQGREEGQDIDTEIVEKEELYDLTYDKMWN